MSVVSNRQLYLYTVGLLIVWIIVLTTASSSSHHRPVEQTLQDDPRNIKSCKLLCDHCNCLGFYCGEECICECNNDDDNTDTECIARMQENARVKKMPFELLIQGPSTNSFLRNALQFEQNNEKRNIPNLFHKKRSTVIVYKPELNGSKSKLVNKSIKNLNEAGLERPKRASTSGDVHKNNQFEWFSDLTQNLVKPAPLGGRNRKTEESKTPITDKPKAVKTYTPLDKSWFMDTIPNILTPAPLAKRTDYSSSESSSDHEDNEESSNTNNDTGINDPLSSPPLFPKHRKDTFGILGKDLTNAFGLKNDAPEVEEEAKMLIKDIRNKRKEVNLEDSNDYMEDKPENTLDDLRKSKGKEKHKPPESSFSWDIRRRKPFKDDEDEDESEFRLPWWKPVRFFKKVQYVLKP